MNHRIFKTICSGLGNNDSILLFHTEILWPLTRIFELREVKLLLHKYIHDLLQYLEFHEFIQMLAYLTDIFTHMNNLSLSLQGTDVSILNCHEKWLHSKINYLFGVGE